MNLIEKLQEWKTRIETSGQADYTELAELLGRAEREISRLRLIVGAVSEDTNSFRDMFRRNTNAL